MISIRIRSSFVGLLLLAVFTSSATAGTTFAKPSLSRKTLTKHRSNKTSHSKKQILETNSLVERSVLRQCNFLLKY
jgi:hypothetical protein